MKVLKTILKTLCFTFVAILIFFAVLAFKHLDPNYTEFGPTISLYEDKECANLPPSKDCLIISQRVSVHRKRIKTLYGAIKSLGSSERSDVWQCTLEEKKIENVKEEQIQEKPNATYKCWPP